MARVDVSIIVPVYNAEKYLERCLVSIVNALKEYNGSSEIVVVDNMSQDGSINIINKYTNKYPKLVKPIRCTTPGAGAARNLAIKKSSGRFFWFVDADDEIRHDAISMLVDKITTSKADFVMLGMSRIYPDNHRDIVHAPSSTSSDFRSRFIRSELGPVQVFVRKSWYVRNNFVFCEGMIHEDMEMMPALILYTDNFSSIDEPLYLYHQNINSTLHKVKWDAHYFDIFPALEGLYTRFSNAGAINTYYAELEWFFIWNLLMDSAEYFHKFKEGREGRELSRKMLKKYFPKWRHNKFLKNVNIKTKIKIFVNYYI